jgi:hypothetical protein
VRVALAAGLVLLAIAIGVRLSRPPLAVIATNMPGPEAAAGVVSGQQRLCQEGETLPAGTSAIRLGISVNVGPRVAVTVFSGSQAIAQGAQPAGWTGEAVTVPVKTVPSTILGADVCVALGPTLEPIGLIGQPPRRGSGQTVGRLKLEYLHPGAQSWWSLALPVARRLGLGRSPSGTWVALVPLLLMVAAAALVAWLIPRELRSGGRGASTLAPIAGAQVGAPPVGGAPVGGAKHAGGAPPTADTPRGAPPIDGVPPARAHTRAHGWRLASNLGLLRTGRPARRLREPLRRVPSAAWACGAIAWLSAASWSIVMPPFQVPDEPAHFAYVQDLAEQGRVPHSNSVTYSPEEMAALRDLGQNEVRYNPLHGTIASPTQQRRLERDLAQLLVRHGEGVGVAWSQPPLYYALQAIPYRLVLAAGGNLLERLALMRLLSALLAGLTALFAYLFLREALPGVPWAWTVGGLGVALFPLVGFIAGAVNPDGMLCAVCAALLFCLARAFRQGLSRPLAIAIGVATAVGFLTKLNFVGLVPGLVLALAVLAWRARRDCGRPIGRSVAPAVAIGASPVCVYALINLLSHHSTLGLTSSAAGQVSRHGSPFEELAYVWQFYLPRLPGMTNYFPGLLTSQFWFERVVGLYGWLDTTFPAWVYDAALIPAGAIAALCAAALIGARAALRRRAGELLAYVTLAVGLLALIGVDSFLQFPGRAGAYAEPRYLLPLAALFGAILVLAARGAGRRWGPAVGALIVVLILGHDLFSQLLTVARYYG